MQKKIISITSIIIGFLFLTTANAYQSSLPSKLEFNVEREGESIGEHSFLFESSGSDLQVKIDTNIAVKILGFKVYSFEHNSIENWQDNQLVSLKSTTNDNGTRNKLNVANDQESLSIKSTKRNGKSDVTMLPASLWNHDLVKQKRILNTLDGTEMDISVLDMGETRLMVKGQMKQVKHYKLTGMLERDLWYDNDNNLVQVDLKGEDGSSVRYLLK